MAMNLTMPELKGIPLQSSPTVGIPLVPPPPPPAVAPQPPETPITTSQEYSIEDIGARIRSKSPEKFAGFSDMQIGQRALEKKPELQKLIKIKSSTPVAPQVQNPFDVVKQEGGIGGLAGKFLGGLTNLAKGAIKGVGSTLASAGDIGGRALEATVGQRNKKVTGLGKELQEGLLKPVGTAQKIGFGAEKVGEFFLPSGLVGQGAKAIEAANVARGITGLGATALNVGGRAALEGVGAAGISTLQGAKPQEIATNALLAGGGSVVGAGLSKLGKGLAKPLKESAQKSYAQVLGPTTKENKAITQRIVPRLIEEGKTALSRTGLLKKAQKGVDLAGEAMDRELAKIPKDAVVSTKNVIQELEKSKEAFLVAGANGKLIPADPGAIKHIEGFQKILSEIGAEEAPFESVRRLRQIWDKGIQDAKGFYGKTLSEGSLLEAQKTAADAIRKELIKGRPDLAKANADFNFWSNAQKVLSETIQRKQGQARPLTETIRRVGGAAAGAMAGGPAGAVAGDVVMGALSKLVDSTAWKTIGALKKTQIADYLAKGKLDEAMKIITRFSMQTPKNN